MLFSSHAINVIKRLTAKAITPDICKRIRHRSNFFFCDECSKGFVNKSNLRYHFKHAHKLKKMDEKKVSGLIVPNKGIFLTHLLISKECILDDCY